MSEYDSLWIEEEVRSFGIYVPQWIEQDITCSDVAAIIQGGCESGAYMPAATYHQAIETMKEYDEEILNIIEDCGAEPPSVLANGWYHLAAWLVSCAVELWCSSIADELAERIQERDEVDPEEE